MFHQKFEKPAEGIADLGGPVELKLKEQNKRIVVHDFEMRTALPRAEAFSLRPSNLHQWTSCGCWMFC
jgi:hypothetical protein